MKNQRFSSSKAEFGRRRMVLGALVGEEHIQLPFG